MIDLPDDPAPRPRPQGARTVLLVLALVAILSVAVYLAGIARLHRTPPVPAPPAAQADVFAPQIDALRQRVANLEQQVATLAARPDRPGPSAAPATDASATALAARMDDLTSRLRGDEARIEATAAHAARTARLQAAAVALAGGQPIGDIPGAPAALARFRTDPPPTEAQLRRSFPDAARLATRPETADLGVWQAMRARLAGMITVRRGTHLILGSPATRSLETAQLALDAGDLPGAVSALNALDPPAAAAIAAWRAQAQALLDARAALGALQASG